MLPACATDTTRQQAQPSAAGCMSAGARGVEVCGTGSMVRPVRCGRSVDAGRPRERGTEADAARERRQDVNPTVMRLATCTARSRDRPGVRRRPSARRSAELGQVRPGTAAVRVRQAGAVRERTERGPMLSLLRCDGHRPPVGSARRAFALLPTGKKLPLE